MPAADTLGDSRNDHERQDRPDKKQKSSSSNSKSKDLSHVPCKFFKVGGCTAGPSCPFSHTLPEPGQKEHCAWFVKGNCKFGHKCALAHVLPGQDMSMDRKNKKAAQQAAAAAGGHERGGKDRGGKKRDGGGADRGSGGKNPLLAGGSTAPTRVLNSGSSGPSGAGRPPMNLALKASISPSAPAPPLNDNDFASFAPLDEMEGVSDDSKQKPQPSEGESKPASSDALPVSAARGPSSTAQNDFGPIGSPPNARSPIRPNSNNATFSPGTSPRNLNGISASPNTANAAGILSSSPFSAPGNQTTFYQPSSYGASLGLTGGVAASLGSGMAMMGGGRKGWGDPSSFDPSSPSNAPYMSTSHQQRTSGLSTSVTRFDDDYEFGNARNLRKIPGLRNDHAVLDEEMEDALPGSLTDLLTPEERIRRMSRSNSGQPPHGLTALANTLKGDETPSGSSGMGIGHRHSRSVPAPSLLGDLKSIWADTSGNALPSSPGNTSHMTHRGTPSASGLSARFETLGLGNGGVGGGAIDEAGLSMSFGSPSSIGMMSPSNASAAFLPGFRETYLAAKAKQQAQGGQSGLGRGLRSVSGGSGLYPGSDAGARVNNNSLANNYLQPISAAGLPASMNSSSTLHTHIHGNTQHTYRTPSSPFDLTQSMNMIRKAGGGLGGLDNGPSAMGGGHGLGIGGDIAGMDDPLLGPQISSPSTRALRSHAPGQSLPQGLAAGLSRIHALPPLSNIVSPGTPSGLGAAGYLSASPGNALSSNAAHHGMYGGDWSSGTGMISGSPLVQSTVAPGNGEPHQPQPRNGASGLTNALSAQAHGAPPGLPERAGGNTGGVSGSMKMSYSAAAAASRAASATPTAPPGITRNPGYAQQHQQQGQQQRSSNHDDDELFDMDG